MGKPGDFLGGVSSPLAFLWLVLGFFQQGREIRLSNKALQLLKQCAAQVTPERPEDLRISLHAGRMLATC